MAETTQLLHCVLCDKDFTRPVVRGKRPVRCPECKSNHRGKTRSVGKTCAGCGKPGIRYDARFCSRACGIQGRATTKPYGPKPLVHPKSRPGPLLAAVDAADHAEIIRLMLQKCHPVGDCMVWPKLNRSGYPSMKLRERTTAAHRVMLEAKLGAPLGSQSAHHTCANAACVNPDHLVPVTEAQNTAEMLARKSYQQRICELESALAALSPQHPLLQVHPLA